MTRDEWIFSALTLTTLAAVAVGVWLVAALRRWPRLVHRSLPEVPAPARRAVTSRLERACLAMAALAALWLSWFHALILRANAVTPPQLDTGAIALWVGAQLLVVAGFVLYVHRTVTRYR